MIENLLHLCRSEEGRIELDVQSIKLDEVIAKVCQSLSEEAAERDIVIEPPITPMPLVLADPQWLELVLQNLVFNAISHSPTGSRVTIKTVADATTCSLEIENPMEDPLATEDLEDIFKRFWRKDSARAAGRHAGIGLSLVKSYVDLMRFEVQATATNKQFCIVLRGMKIA